jgi:hypothetical protein
MEKEIIKKLVDDGYSTKQIAKKLNKSQTSIMYWLKKYDLKTNFESFKQIGIKDYGNKRVCPKCTESKDITEFYNRRGKSNSSVYCKICTNLQTIVRQRELKLQSVNYKGGCCQICGYDKCLGALEFHHLDPSVKEFNLSRMKSSTFNEKITKELDKCIMVCANCHREIHYQK